MTEGDTTMDASGPGKLYTRTATNDFGILLIRLMLGVVFMFHGSQKMFGWFGGPGMEGTEGFISFVQNMGFPYPEQSAYLSAYTEFFGGLLLIIGFVMRLAVIPMAVNMFVACYVHGKAFSVQNNGLEYPLTMAFVLIGLCLLGAGRFSLDGVIRAAFSRGRRKPSSRPAPA